MGASPFTFLKGGCKSNHLRGLGRARLRTFPGGAFVMKSTFTRTGSRLLAGAATIALSSVALSTPAHAIVPNDNSPDEIVDTDEEFAVSATLPQ